jgi:hypothetical protein
MEFKKREFDFAKLPKDVVLHTCAKTRDNKQPWLALKYAIAWKTVSRHWYNYMPTLAEITAVLGIPMHSMYYAAATNDVDEILRLKLEAKHSERAPDENMLLPIDFAFGLEQHKAIKILGMVGACRRDQEAFIVMPRRNYTKQDINAEQC